MLLMLLGSAITRAAIVDLNGNGMSDVWEAAYSAAGLDPNADKDRDGQTNLQESTAGTDPRDAHSVFRVAVSAYLPEAYIVTWQSVLGKRYQLESLQSLVDGVWLGQGPPMRGTGSFVTAAAANSSPPPVAFRLRLLVNNPAVLNARSALAGQDTDGDGMMDLDEFAAGTDPFDPSSFLAISSVSAGKAFVLSWPSIPGKRYQIESRTNSLVAPWKKEAGVLEGDGSVLSATLAVNSSDQFFRVAVFDVDTDLDGVSDWEEQIAGLPTGPLHYRTNFPTTTAAISALLTGTNVINLDLGAAVANTSTLAPGIFRINRSGHFSQVTVRYTVGGDAVPGQDYVPLPGTVTLPPGVNQVDIPVTPLAGAVLAPQKSVTLTVQADAGYVVGTNVTQDIHVLKEVTLSVRDFGAVGDGVTDDTIAIQSAINALAASTNYNTLHFPAGTYRLNSPVSSYDEQFGWNNFLLWLGGAELTGRDLLMTGEPGAVLYSTISWIRTRMLVAEASFRSLTFRGLTWRKESNVLPAFPGREPNGAEGVWLKVYDLRRVEAVDFEACTFDNCHGALLAVGPGSQRWGKLAHLGFVRCQVLNPFGSNTTDGQTAYGGGQQVRLDRWVGEAIYRDTVFDGGSDSPDPVKNPGGVPKDGCHFGSPMCLVFTNNIVRRMGVEAIFQTDEPYLGSTGSFTVPPPNGIATAQVPLLPSFSDYPLGETLNFRAWPPPTYSAVNIYLTAVAYDPVNSVLTVKNYGLTPGLEGTNVPFAHVYLQTYNPEIAVISGNVVDAGARGGSIGITATAKATINGNFIEGFAVGVGQYGNNENELFPPTRHSLIDSNVILTRDPSKSPFYTYGIISYGPEDLISNNLVFTPASMRFIGVYALGYASWIEANTVIAQTIVRQGYGSNDRSVGIGVGNTSTECTAAANRTCGFDVGLGPDAYQSPLHRVISHFSTNDVLAVDLRGVISN